MQITTEQLSQIIDVTLETEVYASRIPAIINGLDELSYTEEAVTLEDLWEDVHPGTLEGMHNVVDYLEVLNDFMYAEAQHDNAVSDEREDTLEDTTTGEMMPW